MKKILLILILVSLFSCKHNGEYHNRIVIDTKTGKYLILQQESLYGNHYTVSEIEVKNIK